MRNGLPFSKPRVRLHGDVCEAQTYLGEAYNLLFRVRQFCEASGAPVFAMSRTMPDGAVVTAAIVGGEEIVSCSPPLIERGGALQRKRTVEEELINFYAVPTSMAHQSGYTPARQGEPYPGPSSVWENYPSDKLTPKPAPRDPGNAQHPELTPSYTLNQHPGTLTWFSEQVREGGLPVVVSWRGLSCRYGRWPQLRGTGGYTTTTDDGVENPQIYPGRNSSTGADSFRFEASAVGRSSLVWINGRPAILVPDTLPAETPFAVWSAALKRELDPETDQYVTRLYIVCRDHLYRGEITKWKAHPGPDKTPKELSVSLVGRFEGFYLDAWESRYELRQPPFINASCTKCVFLYDSISSGSEISLPRLYSSTLAEGDFETLAVTTVKKNNATVVYGAQSRTFVQTFKTTVSVGDWDLDHEGFASSETSAGTWENTETVLAADYKQDELVFLEERRKLFVSPPETHESTFSTVKGMFEGVLFHIYDEIDYERESLPASNKVVFVHSTLGEVYSYEQVCLKAGHLTASQTGGLDAYISHSHTANIATSYSWPCKRREAIHVGSSIGFHNDVYDPFYGFLTGGDLRFDAFAIGVFAPDLSDYHKTAALSVVYPPILVEYYPDANLYRGRELFSFGTHSSRTDNLTLVPRVRYAAFAHGAKVFDVAGLLFPTIVDLIAEPSFSEPNNEFLFAMAETSSWPEDEVNVPIAQLVAGPSLPQFSYDPSAPQPHPNAALAVYANHDADRQPGYACHFAFSPDGKYGYVGFRPPRLYGEGGAPLPDAHYESWVLKDDEGVVTQVAIEESEFAPGEASTLAAPVFFGANIVKYEEDDPVT